MWLENNVAAEVNEAQAAPSSLLPSIVTQQSHRELTAWSVGQTTPLLVTIRPAIARFMDRSNANHRHYWEQLAQIYTLKLMSFRTQCAKLGRERERNVLFNDALNTFYLRLYGVRHMVKDHSDSEKGNPLQPHRLLLSINSKGYFICTIPQTG